MGNPVLMFRIEIGFDPDRGYAAIILDLQEQRTKAIRGNSMQQITSRIRNVLNEEARKARHFPMEAEKSSIITPNGFE